MMKLLFLIPLFFMIPLAYADHSEVTIVTVLDSGVRGCENTAGCYLPSIVTADVGGIVIMSNVDSVAHTFTSGIPSSGPDGTFDTGLLVSNSSFEWIATKADNIPYFCMIHPWMVGTIVISGDSDVAVSSSVVSTQDNNLEIENEQLKNEIRDLKIENKQLKNEINSLKDQIVSMTDEFMKAVISLNQWFSNRTY